MRSYDPDHDTVPLSPGELAALELEAREREHEDDLSPTLLMTPEERAEALETYREIVASFTVADLTEFQRLIREG